LALPDCGAAFKRLDRTNCFGTLVWPDGNKYIGEFRGWNLNGQGTYFFKDGGKYVGEFEGGKRNGQGTYTSNVGITKKGVWKNDKFQYAVPSFLHTAFTKLPISLRKQVQSKLAKANHYKSSIDGLYGKGTEAALIAYNKKEFGGPELTKNENVAKLINSLLIKEVSIPCDLNNPSTCDSSQLCGRATYNEQWENRPLFQPYVDEAKRRGLTCGVARPNSNQFCSKDPKFCDPEELCIYASHNGSWKVASLFEGYVSEAKRRGLTCGTASANLKPVIEKTCSSNPTRCSASELCAISTTTSNGQKSWKQGAKDQPYVELAREIGLTCGVVSELAKTPKAEETRKVSSGSGFYVSNLGHIITNHHVIDGCGSMQVHVKGKMIEAIKIADDVMNDLALLKIEGTPGHVFALSDKSPYPLQDIIVAGFPFGERFSSSLKFTQGIVSSLTGIGNNYSEIQIDAALQPGNSGGPIMDELGNIVGVAVSKLNAQKIFKEDGIIPTHS
jgi:hypothetical protein